MTWRPGQPGPPPKEVRRTSDVTPSHRPSRWEWRDFVLSFLLLGVTFTILSVGGYRGLLALLDIPKALALLLAYSLVTAGIGFVCHEFAHRAVAIHFDRAAAFRAHYGMLMLGIATALAGFIFAAPGGVHLRRDVPRREHGLVALAGPVTNLILGVVFVGLYLGSGLVPVEHTVPVAGISLDTGGLLEGIGRYGFVINFLLAGFNMLPFGPLDGGRVYLWSTPVYVAIALPSIVLGAVSYFVIGF